MGTKLWMGLLRPKSFWPPSKLSKDRFSITSTTTFLILSLRFWIDDADALRLLGRAVATAVKANRPRRALGCILTVRSCLNEHNLVARHGVHKPKTAEARGLVYIS